MTGAMVQPPLDFRPHGATVTYEPGSRADQFRGQWAAFVAAHPDVIRWVVAEVFRAQMRGRQMVSAKTLLGRAREEFRVRIDNNWPSVAADWLEAQHPEFCGLFVRKRRPAEDRPAAPKQER